MKITLLSETFNGMELISAAGYMCYTDDTVEGIIKRVENSSKEAIEGYIKNLLDKKHYSVLEHVSFSFGIEGISRACSHQLVRHRIASYSQRSQRYVSEKQFKYVTPETFDNMTAGTLWFENKMKTIQKWYNEAIKAGVPKEDARYLLPNACETSLIMTMNIRELLHFFTVRCCNRAQLEIKNMAIEMLKILKTKYPVIFENVGPSCVSAKCNEGSLSCGKMKEVKTKFKNLIGKI